MAPSLKSSVIRICLLFPLVIIFFVTAVRENLRPIEIDKYDHSKLSNRRIVFENLISADEASMLMELIKPSKRLFNSDSKNRDEILNTFDIFNELYGQTVMTKSRIKLLQDNLVAVLDRIHGAVESFFGFKVKQKSAVFYARMHPDTLQVVEKNTLSLKERGIKSWQVIPHADNCMAALTSDGVSCYRSPEMREEFCTRDISSVLFLNEPEGGHFTFVDFPNVPVFYNQTASRQYLRKERVARDGSTSHRSLQVSAPYRDVAPPDLSSLEASPSFRKYKNITTISVPYAPAADDGSSSSGGSNSGSSKRRRRLGSYSALVESLPMNTVFTVVAPKVGRLVFFTSGAFHVTRVVSLSCSRLTLSPTYY